MTQAQIEAKLQVSGGQTQKSQWSLKSLTEKTDVANLAVVGKTLDNLQLHYNITIYQNQDQHIV